MDLWRVVVVRKWFGSFSQLVGDNQFAVLGLVLLGCLGRVCELIGVTEMMIEEGDDDVGEALKGFAKGEEEVADLVGVVDDDVGVPIKRHGGDDIGETVMRVEEDVPVEDENVYAIVEETAHKVKPKKRKTQDSAIIAVVETPPKKAKTKKAKKKRDTIDDLFSGLL